MVEQKHCSSDLTNKINNWGLWSSTTSKCNWREDHCIYIYRNKLFDKRLLPIYKSTKISAQRLKFDLFKPEKKKHVLLRYVCTALEWLPQIRRKIVLYYILKVHLIILFWLYLIIIFRINYVTSVFKERILQSPFWLWYWWYILLVFTYFLNETG